MTLSEHVTTLADQNISCTTPLPAELCAFLHQQTDEHTQYIYLKISIEACDVIHYLLVNYGICWTGDNSKYDGNLFKRLQTMTGAAPRAFAISIKTGLLYTSQSDMDDMITPEKLLSWLYAYEN